MSDGNTAVQVSPIVQESEMSHVREIFDRAANAIIQSSELAVKVNELVKIVDDLRHEVETIRNQNRWLDEQLVSVRQSRDAALEELSKVKNDLALSHSEHAKVDGENYNLRSQVEALTSALADARKHRDDNAAMWEAAENELSKHKAKLATITDFAKGLIEEAQPKPEAQPVALPDPSPLPEAYTFDKVGSNW